MKLFVLPLLIFACMSITLGQDTITVGVETASIRSAPSVKASVIKTAKHGDSFELVAQKGAWNKVKIGKSFGWIHGNAIAARVPADRWGDPDTKFNVMPDVQSGGLGPGMGTGRGTGQGNGIGGGMGNGNPSQMPTDASELYPAATTSDLRILSKPKVEYTEAARRAQINGTVQLKVTFLASGEIGNVVAIKELPEGLTEQAINAAKGIRFQPKRLNGVPQTVTKIVEYSFSIY